MITTYVVVAGNFARGHTLYGPFASVEAAHEWANDPLRAEETRAEFRVVPLFGGLLVTGEPVPDEVPGWVLPDPDSQAEYRRKYLADEDDAERAARWTGTARP